MKDFRGKVAFITGGGSGIGFGMATTFLKAGMKVVIGDIRKDRLERAEVALKQISPDIRSVEVDSTNSESLARAAEVVKSAFGNLHVLCNNAGVGYGGPVLKVPDAEWERVLNINLWGVIKGIQVFLPGMLQHGEGGHVVNTSSFTGIVGHHSQSAYGVSKFAVVGLSEFLRNDMENQSVSVSVLCPHVVDTPIFYADIDDMDVEAIKKRRSAMSFLDEIGVSPEAVGNMVLRGIETDELYIFCDGKESRQMMEGRTRALFDAMDRQFPPSK
jgi:NAD(P)-dependent dehydrogenase (short-subunit alcohol dehydrogenase family)